MDWDNLWARGSGTLPVAASLLLLSAYACGESTHSHQDEGAGGSGGNGGTNTSGGAGGALTSGSGTGGSSGGSGQAGAGGEAGASTSTSGGAGTSGLSCTPVTPPDTRCEYPESLGGGSDSKACGVTPGAWFGIGESELTTWPDRTTLTSPHDGLFGSFRSQFGRRQLEFDAAGVPVVAWLEVESAQSDDSVMRFSRFEGSDWLELEAAARRATGTGKLLVDSAGRLLVAGPEMSVSRFADSAWENLGVLPDGYIVDAALDSNDLPTILHYDSSLTTEENPFGGFMVRRWTGSTWEAFGVLPGNIYSTVLALRSNGDPVVAFYDQGQLMLRQWSGSSWDELAGSASGSGLGEPPEPGNEDSDLEIALAVDADDQLVIAWGGNYRVWNGSAWSATQSVGGPRPRLARNGDGALYLMSQSDPDSLQERLLYRWSTDAWEPLPPTTAEFTEAVDLAVAPDGSVGMLFGHLRVFYRGYAGGEWGDLEAPAGATLGVNLASYPGVPEVPVILSSCYLSQWNGTTWDVIPPPAEAYYCAFNRNSDGDAYLAFWEGPDRLHLRVARQTDDGWEILADPEAGISEEERAVTQLAIDSQGWPVVAWQDGWEYSYPTHLLRWNGSSWTWWGDSPSVPLPSYNAGRPSLSLTADDRPVLALTEYIGDYERILHVAEWTGEGWRASEAMTHEDPSGEFSQARLALDAGDTPVVSWQTESSLELARWSGSAWEQLAPTDDVLGSLPLSLRVSLRVVSNEALFRYFADCAWRGLSASDRAKGVSNSTDAVTDATLWASEAAVCVHWTERATEEHPSNDFMRCHTW